MSDAEIPADLIELKVGFLTTERKLAEFAATLPSGSAIASGKAELSAEQLATYDGFMEQLRYLAEQSRSHPFLMGLAGADRLKAEEAARKAAKQLSAA